MSGKEIHIPSEPDKMNFESYRKVQEEYDVSEPNVYVAKTTAKSKTNFIQSKIVEE